MLDILGIDTEIQIRTERLSDGSYQCVECKFTTPYSSTLKCHIEAKHLFTSGYACNVCSKFCPSRNALSTHMSRYHRRDRK